MATAARPFLATAPATRIARVSNTTLFALAAKYYGDALLWTKIAEVNGMVDPWITAAAAIIIPDVPPQTSPPTGLLRV